MTDLKKYMLLTALAFSLTKTYAQQTLQYSQYMFNGLAVNPAYAGYKEDWTLSVSSRLQWVGVDGAPKTSTVAIDGVTSAKSKNIGLGILVNNDRLGPENNSSAYINYSYRIRLDEADTKRLCFGIGVGAIQYTVDGSQFNAADITDGYIPTGLQSKLTADFRAGIYYYSPWIYFGASMLNLYPQAAVNTTANMAVITPVRTLYATVGFMVPISPLVDWKPSVMIKEDFKGPTNLDAATYFLFGKVLWIGGAYSTGVTLWNKTNLPSNLYKTDAITGIMAISFSSRYRIGYSYDFNTNKIPGYNTASHEVSLSFSFGRRNDRILSPRYF